MPYYPKNWPGGYDRIVAWGKYFEVDDVKFDVFPAWSEDELKFFLKCEETRNEIGRYRIYLVIYFRRIYTIFKLRNYKTVWVQRAYIPLFPFKSGVIEKLISKIHPNVIYDFYDADYESNYKLVFDTVSNANKITIASRFLENKFKEINSQVYFVRYTVNTEKFVNKRVESEILKIGWMGSPENAEQLIKIADQLKKIEEEYPNVIFSFVCRDLPELGLKNIQVFKWADRGFNYYDWLSGIDIGLVPFILETDRVRAKISMKSLEFMAAEIPMVVSPYVHSDMLNHTNCQIARPEDWYTIIKSLIEDSKKRANYGSIAKMVFEKYHTYDSVYPILKKVLIDDF